MAPWPYNDARWRAAREALLAGEPTCRATPGCPRVATELDHWPVPVERIRRGRADPELAFDPANLRPACKRCNSAAGARLGNARRGATRARGEVARRAGTRRASRRW